MRLSYSDIQPVVNLSPVAAPVHIPKSRNVRLGFPRTLMAKIFPFFPLRSFLLLARFLFPFLSLLRILFFQDPGAPIVAIVQPLLPFPGFLRTKLGCCADLFLWVISLCACLWLGVCIFEGQLLLAGTASMMNRPHPPPFGDFPPTCSHRSAICRLPDRTWGLTGSLTHPAPPGFVSEIGFLHSCLGGSFLCCLVKYFIK